MVERVSLNEVCSNSLERGSLELNSGLPLQHLLKELLQQLNHVRLAGPWASVQ